MKSIRVENICINDNRIEINYSVSAELTAFFSNKEMSFWIEYSEDISRVPIGIAIIPFVCNVLPIVWLTDAILYLPSIDKTFYESIKEFKQGYINMYPMLEFKGSVEPLKIVDNHYRTDGGNAAFFSGGVDAFTTLICHRSEHPTLITLRGADVKLDDIEGWTNVYNHLQDTVKQFNLPTPICVTSNFRTFIDEGRLSQLVVKSNDGWWHGFQHGIGILSQAAPIAFCRHFSLIYIASSLSPYVKGTCASYPTIDNFLKYGSTSIMHDQFEDTRQDKIRLIIDYCKNTKQKIDLRVCWISRGGKNCCRCEKCLRTIFALLAEGVNAQQYGFDNFTKYLFESKSIVTEQLYNAPFSVKSEWENSIVNRFNETGAYKDDPRINWVYTLDPYAKKPSPPKPSLLTRIVRKIRRTLKS